MSKQYNCCELFAGCGGLGLGFHQKYFNIVCANELESDIGETYIHNFPDTKVVIGDVTNDKIKKKIYNAFKKNDCDVLIGGPPCVAYSMSGHRNSRDPRGQLFRDYVEIVDKLKTKVFVMENVKGILSMLHDKEILTTKEKELADMYYELEKEKLDIVAKKKLISAKNNEEDLDNIKKSLKDINKRINRMKKDIPKFREKVTDKIVNQFKDNYYVDFKLHNSANFGVPQKRERVIFIGVRKDLYSKDDIKFPQETYSEDKWITVKNAIDDLKDLNQKDADNSNIKNHILTTHTPSFLEKIQNTPIGKSVNPKYTEAFFRCSPQKPSNTVKENHGAVFVHYEKDRVMTPRELARLQSFPDDFEFKGSKSCMLVQLGNAVPVKLANAIAGSVKEILDINM